MQGMFHVNTLICGFAAHNIVQTYTPRFIEDYVFIVFHSSPVRSVLDPLPCSDGVRGHGCVSRRQRSVRPAVK